MKGLTMALTRREIEALIKVVAATKAEEPTCDDCLRDLAEFAERALEGRSITESLTSIERHLAMCTECREEYEALLAAIQDAK